MLVLDCLGEAVACGCCLLCSSPILNSTIPSDCGSRLLSLLCVHPRRHLAPVVSQSDTKALCAVSSKLWHYGLVSYVCIRVYVSIYDIFMFMYICIYIYIYVGMHVLSHSSLVGAVVSCTGLVVHEWWSSACCWRVRVLAVMGNSWCVELQPEFVALSFCCVSCTSLPLVTEMSVAYRASWLPYL